MADKSAFTQISSDTLWNSLSPTLRDGFQAFSPQIAARIDINLARAMDASPAFKTYLALQAAGGPDSILLNTASSATFAQDASATAQTPRIQIAESDFTRYATDPATLVKRIGHDRADWHGHFQSGRAHQQTGMRQPRGHARAPLSISGEDKPR